ncbi:MAG: hypothetical protein A2X94_00970 [Bdellovibrionales bacterium GWB1_55_8]|nr:MAG: hypothetical protein A2X94_00970 [Bdellovibrionales bacterium GWB1_55_8]
MNLNYDRIKSRVEQGSHQWTSYSDLFLVLSVTFLLLYVVANLRSGTSSIVQSQALQAARTEVSELQKQLKTYEVLKDDYLQKGPSKDEVAIYQELMDKLTLLETEAKSEHEQALKKARAAKSREDGLNHYQQLVKNIVNANLIASGRLQNKNEVIQEQTRELDVLDNEVNQKTKTIEQNNAQIATIESELKAKAERLKTAYRTSKKNRALYEKELRELENESGKRIATLRDANNQFAKQLDETKTRLDEKNRQAEKLVAELSARQTQFESQMTAITATHETSLSEQKRQFDEALRDAKLSAQARVEKEREYRAAVESRNAKFKAEMDALNGDLAHTRSALKNASGKYQESIAALQKTNQTLEQDLKTSITKLNEQRRLAEQIKKNFSKSGIQAQVDPKSGDVTIEFQPEYFDTDSSALKGNMRRILEKTIPVYAKSLFEDGKISKRISSVEIVGFASPTFQGKVVDPGSLSAGDRQAVNYNMDLSYRRAKSIFEFVFDPNRLNFEHQKALLPLVKVSGRSYLGAEPLKERGLASRDDYCSRYDCRKSQMVIIKFNLKEQ